MQVTVYPTLEMCTLSMDGNPVEVRLWKGTTDQNTPIEMYVVCVVQPDDPNGVKLAAELPDFMCKGSGWLYSFQDGPVIYEAVTDSTHRK